MPVDLEHCLSALLKLIEYQDAEITDLQGVCEEISFGCLCKSEEETANDSTL